jgi:hypothetical protein
MSSNTLKPVILKHNHAIKGRKDYVSDPYSGKSFERKVKDGQVLDKSIHSYRMWFNFLKLALELEAQNTVLVTRNATLRKYMSGHQSTGRVTHKVRVNRAKYQDWNVDEMLHLKFDDWWKEHEHLFLSQVGRVMKPHEVVSSDPDKLGYEIDLRRRFNDLIQDLRKLYEENTIERVTRDEYSIEGKVRPIVLQNKFNALVLKLEDKLSNQEILSHKDNYIRASDTRTAKSRSTNEGRVINELIGGNAKKNSFGAKQILLSVCDGYFMMHPTKNYL